MINAWQESKEPATPAQEQGQQDGQSLVAADFGYQREKGSRRKWVKLCAIISGGDEFLIEEIQSLLKPEIQRIANED